MIELRRADIGFGKVVIDDKGVVRHGLLRTHGITWDNIDEYRLTVEIRKAAFSQWSPDPIGEVMDLVDDIRGKNRVYRLSLELVGRDAKVEINWRFRNIELAIGEVLSRVHERLLPTEPTRFGPLLVTADEVGWDDRRLPRDRVESIELFDSSPLSLRVLERDKVLPFARIATQHVPNVLLALERAKALGYRTKGSKLMQDAFARADGHVLFG